MRHQWNPPLEVEVGPTVVVGLKIFCGTTMGFGDQLASGMPAAIARWAHYKGAEPVTIIIVNLGQLLNLEWDQSIPMLGALPQVFS